MTFLAGGAGLLLLYFGGSFLVRGAAALAGRLGMSAMAIGLTVVAFGTSAPELVVSLDAAMAGASDMALANVVGSNIANLALILGLAALIRPVATQAGTLRFDVPLLVGASLLLLALLGDGALSRTDGGLLLVLLVAYATWTFRLAAREPDEVKEEFATVVPGAAAALAADLGFIVVGLLALVGGGHLLVGAGLELSRALGLSEAFVGLTVVALGTSLPELATSVVASLKGQGDIAVGNVVGSNLFNILGILGVTALVDPLARGGILWTDLAVMAALPVVLLPLLRTKMSLSRWEGAALVACFAGYVGWLLVSA